MAEYNDFVSILKYLLTQRFFPMPHFISGLLGDGVGNVLVPGRPDYNYARFNRSSSEIFEVFNKEVSQPVDGWPIKIGSFPWQPGLTQVVGTDWSAYAQTGWGDSVASVQSHAPTHEWPNFSPGSDYLSIYMRAISPLRGRSGGTGTLNFYVNEYEYDFTGTNVQWPGTSPLALAAAAPATGTMRYMGVYLNPATNALGAVTGSTTTFAETGEPARPNWPLNVFPVAYARLYGGQAYFVEQDIRDARRIFDTTLMFTGTSAGGGEVVATSTDNPIINGSLLLWQRGTSFASIASGAYTADRFLYGKVGAMVHDVSQSSDVPTVAQAGILAPYSVLIDCTTVDSSLAATDLCIFRTTIEGFNWLFWAQRAFSFSFWVKATKTGTYCVAFGNSGGDRTYVSEYTINAADTWELKTISVTASPSAGTWNYTTGVGLVISWALACGSTFQTTAGAWQTGNYLATANQVNACDNTANNFRLALINTPVLPDFGLELERCKRYFIKVGGVTAGRTIGGRSEGATAALVGFDLPTEMRAAPTVTLVNGSGNVRVNDTSVVQNITSIGGNFSTPTSTAFNVVTDTGLTAFRVVFVDFTATDSFLYFDAEF